MSVVGHRQVSASRLVGIGVLVLLTAFLGIIGYRLANPPGGVGVSGAPGVNSQGRLASINPAPAGDFTLQGFDGESITLSELRGKVVVLNFWSSWCAPCVEEAQVLEKVSRKYTDKNVVVVGANVWNEEQEARNFLDEQGITYPNGRTDTALAAEYGLTGIPETFVIDANGILVRRWLGPLSEQELGGLIDAALPSASAGQ